MFWLSLCFQDMFQWLSLLALRRGWLWPKYQGRYGGPGAWVGNAATRVQTHSGLNAMLFQLFTTCGWDRDTPAHVPSSIVLAWLGWAETDPVLHCSLLLLLVAIIKERNWAKVMVWLFHFLRIFSIFIEPYIHVGWKRPLRSTTMIYSDQQQLFMTILYFSVVKAVNILNTLVSVSVESSLIKPTIWII